MHDYFKIHLFQRFYVFYPKGLWSKMGLNVRKAHFCILFQKEVIDRFISFGVKHFFVFIKIMTHWTMNKYALQMIKG